MKLNGRELPRLFGMRLQTFVDRYGGGAAHDLYLQNTLLQNAISGSSSLMFRSGKVGRRLEL